MKIELLADHRHAIPTLARWYEDEWPPYYGAGGPGDATADLESRLNRNVIPVGLVALDMDRVIGTAALATDAATGLAPSVVGLLVREAFRGRGTGRALIEAAAGLAGRLGHRRVYLCTSILDDLLVGSGWKRYGDASFLNDERGSIFVRDLDAPAE